MSESISLRTEGIFKYWRGGERDRRDLRRMQGGAKGFERTRGEKKERKPKEGPRYSRLPFFLLLLSLSVPRRYRQRSALWKFLAASPLLFSLCYRIMLEWDEGERRKNDARIWVRKELLIRSRIFHRHIYLFVYSLTFFRTQYSRFLGNLIIIFHAKISSSSLENELGMNKVMNKTRFTMFFSNYSSVMLTFPFLENFQ